MKLSIKYDISIACKVILQEQLDKLDLSYKITGLGEVDIDGSISPDKFADLIIALQKYGIEIIDNPKNIFVQKVKDAIVEMVYMENDLPSENISSYLAGKLNHTYGHMSTIFSEVTFTTIANFIILQKIERAKQMIMEGKETLTEIAWKLNYSSVAHLSNQFKKTTGLTPSAFQRIIKKRKTTKWSDEQ